MAKVGRNDPCPCGSKKKYKKCCLDFDKAQDYISLHYPEIRSKLENINAEQKIRDLEWRRQYGHVRPIIYQKWNGKTVVAVGSNVIILEKCKTFHDFLFEYIRTELGGAIGVILN